MLGTRFMVFLFTSIKQNIHGIRGPRGFVIETYHLSNETAIFLILISETNYLKRQDKRELINYCLSFYIDCQTIGLHPLPLLCIGFLKL